MSGTRRASACAAAFAAALAVGACRSDGGFGRWDSSHSTEYAAGCLKGQFERDRETTARRFADLPGSFVAHARDCAHEMGRTLSLYLDAHAPR